MIIGSISLIEVIDLQLNLLMSQSLASRASNGSSVMMEDLANRSQAKILRMEGSFNEEEMRVIWNALGLYISRNLRMGRGINIPKMGIFTFTPPEVSLNGVTNQKERDLRPRTPVFLIQKEFVKGVPLKSAIFYHQEFGLGLRPYTAIGATGQVPITKMNMLEVSTYANMSKDATELALNRMIKYMAQKVLAGQNLNIEIPNVGTLLSRNSLVAVKFNQFLHRDTRTILSKSVDERRKKGDMRLTSDNLRKFAYLSEMNKKLGEKSDQFLEIDDGAKNFLKTNFGFHFDSQNMNRSSTNFDRTVASREFDPRNRSLMSSQLWRMSQSGFMTNKIKTFNREYNMSLRLVKEWVNTHCKDSEKSFKEFSRISGRNNAQALNQDDVWAACQTISVDITEQQAHQLFRILDCNRDGFVTKDDWNKNFKFDSNRLLKGLINSLRSRNLRLSDILKKMGLEGVSSVNVYNLKQSLRKLDPNLTDQEAFFISRYIGRGNVDIPIENVLEVMSLNESNEGHALVDSEWQEKFLARLKRKMVDSDIYEEELESKMRFYDRQGTGYIEQTDFKNVLAELGIGLTLSELIKIVKIFPINSQNHISYMSLLDKLGPTDATVNVPISESEFVKIVSTKFLNQKPLPVRLPISVRQLTSELQSVLFKDEQESHLLPMVKKMDVNSNGEVSEEDLIAYKEGIRHSNKVSSAPTDKLQLDDLIIKIREKSIKKKVSFYDLFKKLDANKDDFITLEEWMDNIGQIIQLSDQQKEDLFEHMDRSKIKMIDYKVFLSIMNGNVNQPQLEKFDWVEQVVQQTKDWFGKSDLSIEDAFRVVDSDGDSYLGEKDLTKFLLEKLKYQQREITHVRMQKLMKVLDGYKRGKIDYMDWNRVIKGSQVNWVKEAKQQIGIVLSRLYPSLSEAYTEITQGERKFVYNSFQRWIKENNALSGFMVNEEMLKHLFSELDNHKKGYLLENDFVGHFAAFNWKSQQTKEFLECLQGKFKSCQEVYRCMSQYHPKHPVDYQKFQKFSKEVFGERFKKSDIKGIWKSLVGSKSAISQQEFVEMFSKYKGWSQETNPIDSEYPKDSWKYQDFNIIKGTTIRSQQFKYSETDQMETQCRKIVDNIKDILLTSAKTLEQVFTEVDTEKRGAVTNLQFKNAFRKLNVAITSKEIDLLVNYCDFQLETLINWKEFIHRFNLKEDKTRIINRIAPRMQHLSDLLHYYMISPKDAYRKWNNPRTGYMPFQEFHKMLKDLYAQAAEPLPEYTVLKELFEHIDIRKDGHLDFQEFTQTFRNFNPPSLLMGTTPMVPDKTKLNDHGKAAKEEVLPIREHKIPLFKHSPKYQEFVKLIGRNRRYLQENIEKNNPHKQPLVNFRVVERVFKDFTKENKFDIDTAMIRNFVAFSMTGDNVDYKLLFENYKVRNEDIVEFPKRNFF